MSERIIRLEACRGLAALAVVAAHTVGAFEPSITNALLGTVFYVAIHGTGAVIFFFVLSGYVLTSRFFDNPNSDRMAAAAVKRLPRLALLTTFVTVASAVIWRLGLYRFEASQLTGSDWLKLNTMAHLPDHFQPSLVDAIWQGTWRTFFKGDSYLDPTLWTMQYEFRGSMLVFLLASFLVLTLRGRLVAVTLLFAALVFRYSDVFMVPFVLGTSIAYYRSTLTNLANPFSTAVLICGGVYMLGFVSPERHYAMFSKLTFWNPSLARDEWFQVLVLTIGASAVIVGVLQSAAAEWALDNKAGALLGRLSFPIYLVHVPIICSASTAAYIALLPHIGRWAFWGAALATVGLSVAVSVPLSWLDALWVRFLNFRVAAFLGSFSE
jgi:peptidoglycan/LPS O-acetylase OafA/YrhL